MLAKRSQKKVDNIFRGVGGAGGDKLNTEEILKYEYASAPIKVIKVVYLDDLKSLSVRLRP